MSIQRDCAVCALIGGESSPGRDELWRTTETIAYLCSFDASSVDQVAVAPLRHAPSLVQLSEAEFASVLRDARDAGTALVRVLDPDGVTLHAHVGAIEQQPNPHFELFLAAKAFGSEFGEVPPEWRQEPWILTDALVAQWDETYEQRVGTVDALRRSLGEPR